MQKKNAEGQELDEKELLLVVSDDSDCRETLRGVLGERYDLIIASDPQAASCLMRDRDKVFSMVLMDLAPARAASRDRLRRLVGKAYVANIPVIAMVNGPEDVDDCIALGAIDVFTKPLPPARLIEARVKWIIELFDSREIIRASERDPLTGLYNREFFFGHAEQYDRHHWATDMDAIVIDVNNFYSINERYGKAYGDDVLRRIGENVRGVVHNSGGIVCRREADTFLIYCPHGKSYARILENASIGLAGDDGASNTRVRLRMGVYACVDKSLNIERRFDRAKLAAKTIRNSFNKTIAIYDHAMHESELFSEQLVEDFHEAISQHQFVVYYQPKYDVRGEQPRLSSAEALVRWEHPRMGVVKPDLFIPLFEKNGMIQELDRYVWREAAAQIRRWKERFGVTLPVSVNVSRVDMYDRELTGALCAIVRDNGLTTHDFLLEITESAYTEDSDSIISTVENMRREGFRVEMDDFGTGYSSLSMISSLPIDALKLDMTFVQSALDKERRNLRMLELVIEIAEHLSVPVVAEGVETLQQMLALKSMGCAFVQGYYFSKPVPAEEFERLIQ